jgi:hypothetical protein
MAHNKGKGLTGTKCDSSYGRIVTSGNGRQEQDVPFMSENVSTNATNAENIS